MADNIDKKYTKKVSMVYFWNAFLPLMLFCVIGFILFVIMKTPDSSADAVNVLAKNIPRS